MRAYPERSEHLRQAWAAHSPIATTDRAPLCTAAKDTNFGEILTSQVDSNG